MGNTTPENEDQAQKSAGTDTVDIPVEQTRTGDGDPDYEKSGEQRGDDELDLGELLGRLEAAEAASQQARNDYLRVQAEMQNLRRRTEQDIEKAHKYGQERFSAELITVMDNLERALQSASGNEDEAVKAIFDGVDLTLKSFSDCFKRFNIEAIDPLGEPFDPQLHQAMSIQDNPDVEPNTVIAVMQKGYTLHGRVIRPAMVIVSKS